MSEKTKQQMSERMRARWAAKRANDAAPAEPTPNENFDITADNPPIPGPQPGDPVAPAEAGYAELLKRMGEMEQYITLLTKFGSTPAQGQGPQTNQRGALVGTFEKYVTDPDRYPSPCARLGDEPRLQRFAFKSNYELAFKVETTSYQTKDGVNTKEPRFTLELFKIMYDDDTGLPTKGRFVVCRMMFHEDPEAAIVVARDNGFDIDSVPEKAFLDEMRYLRMRDWLLEAFYPPKTDQSKKNKKEMVIGGKLVEYFEINDVESQTIPFNELKTKF